jgi:AcrR family transcriptional regulator
LKEKTFERKKELLEAALDEFISKDYETASLNNVIKQAGISKGTFYYHFHDKQALYLYLLEASVKIKWEFMRDRMKERAEDFESEDIFGKFKLQARIGAEFAVSFPKYHRLSRMFSKEKGNKIYKTAKDSLGGSSEKLLDEMIDKAIAEGNFRKDFTRDFLLKVVNLLFYQFDEIFNTEQDFELDTMLMNLDNYVDFMKNGLGYIHQ